MNCGCNRPTLAIIIGIFYLLINLLASGYFIYILVNLAENDIRDIAVLRVVCPILLTVSLLVSVLSALMITGVAQKRYRLITPFVWFLIGGMIMYVITYLALIGVYLWEGADIVLILILLVRIAFAVGLQALILWPVYKLHKEWRAEALGQPLTKSKKFAYQPTSSPAYVTIK